MRHHNSVFHGVLKAVPWDVFERLVEAHEADCAGAPADAPKASLWPCSMASWRGP